MENKHDFNAEFCNGTKNDVASIFHKGKLQQIVKIISKNLLFGWFGFFIFTSLILVRRKLEEWAKDDSQAGERKRLRN